MKSVAAKFEIRYMRLNTTSKYSAHLNFQISPGVIPRDGLIAEIGQGSKVARVKMMTKRASCLLTDRHGCRGSCTHG